MSMHNESRRNFIRKAAYIAPVVLTLNTTPAIATYGSNQESSHSPDSDGPGSKFNFYHRLCAHGRRHKN